MPQKDSMPREISLTVQVVSRALFGKSEPVYLVRDEAHRTPADLLHRDLLSMIADRRFADAEDALFDALDEGAKDGLTEVGMDFYYRLSLLSDDELLSGDFSRAEIDLGLRDLLGACGIELPQFD